jgi:hypothetical protein
VTIKHGTSSSIIVVSLPLAWGCAPDEAFWTRVPRREAGVFAVLEPNWKSI